jgi:hypothetical protein
MLQKKKSFDCQIGRQDFPEFIAKHLFERNPFYGKRILQ